MLDLSDIQGNILRGYRSFPHARFLFFAIDSPTAGRRFIEKLLSLVTPAQWPVRPKSAANVGLSFEGLRALGLDAGCLASFPREFQQGMKGRNFELGDVDHSAPDFWDEPWKSHSVHLVLTVYGESSADLEAHCANILARVPPGVRELSPAQEAGWLWVNGKPTRMEHFGFVDGISNPDIAGVPDGGPGEDIGNPDENGGFSQVAAGEFIIGLPGEGGEMAPMPAPDLLARNCTYLVLRKLQQDVMAFDTYVSKHQNRIDPALLAAKMMGRWPNGSPLSKHPLEPGQSADNEFSYADDPDGGRCPRGAHIRRAYPRDSLNFGGRIVRRRRIIRRGIPYGQYWDRKDCAGAKQPRGIMFLAFNASIERQFEFIQGQWLNYGDEFGQGNDMDPITGSQKSNGGGNMVIQGDPQVGRKPFVASGIPRFVATKGGDYFFVPSLTGLRLIATGQVNVP
jgi:Dyp-type peroxidase family